MIYIREELINHDTIGMWVDGILDMESLPVMRDVCAHHLENHRKVIIYLQGVLHITQEGRDFLQKIQGKVTIVGECVNIASEE